MNKKKPIHNDNPKPANNIIMIANIDNDIDIVKLCKRLDSTLIDTSLDIVSTNMLYYIEKGIPLIDILNAFNLTFSSFELMKIDSPLFSACINKLKDQRTNIMEDTMLSNFGVVSDNLKMFSIKGNLPQYRDNFLPQIQGVSTITINLEGIGSLDINAGKIADHNPKDITDDNINE